MAYINGKKVLTVNGTIYMGENLNVDATPQADTSAHILAFTENKGIYVGTDTGHWYGWDGTQYVDGGVYQATVGSYLEDLGLVTPSDIKFSNANSLRTNGSYFITSAVTQSNVLNLPRYGTSCVFTNILVDFPSPDYLNVYSMHQMAMYTDGISYERLVAYNQGSVTTSGWKKINHDSCLADLGLITPSDIKFSNANTVDKNGSYFITGTITNSNISNLPKYGTSCVFTNIVIYFQPPTYYNTYARHQMASYTDGELYERVITVNNGTPSTAGWKKIYPSPANPTYANNVKVVDKDGYGDYTTIASAVSGASDGDIIYIMPNVYDEHVVMNNKNITLKGFDKNNTLLVHTSKLYNDEPLQANMGVIENLTIIGAYNMTIDESDTDAKSYAIHIDSPNATSDPFNLKIENCNIISHSAPAIGIGCRYNQNISIRNCYIETTKGQYYSSYYSDWKNCGAIFCHNDGGYPNLGNDGYLTVENCELKGKVTALTLQSQDNNNELTIRFLKNTLWSTTNGKTNAISINNSTTSSGHLAGNDIVLDDISFGNNINDINS